VKSLGVALLAASTLLAGCASFSPEPSDFFVQKLRLMQPVLDKTPDGSVGYWKLDDGNFGLVSIDSTMRKSSTTCRLVREDEVKGGRSNHLVASYCKEAKGSWQ